MPESNSNVTRCLPASVEVIPGGPVTGTICPPGSKSLTNRALICAGFALGQSVLRGALRSEDTEVMIDALASIGVGIEVSDGGRTLIVDGLRTVAASQEPVGAGSELQDLYIANSGTTVRFLVAALSALGGQFRLHGVDRMHARPIGDLIAAIKPVIDGSIEALSPNGCPPVDIRSRGWHGSDIEVGGAVSSQYLSGLMMAAPIASSQTASDVTEVTRVSVMGELVSRPYVDMTAEVMRAFAADVCLLEEDLEEDRSLVVAVGRAGYRGTTYEIEPDASAASYFWATAAITGGCVTVEGLSRDAMQGDVGFCHVLEKMGCEVHDGERSISVKGGQLRGVDIDMNHISDTVQTLAVVALFAQGPTRVRGVAHNRFKETDRIGDLARELRKLGATIDEHEDGLTIHPIKAAGIDGSQGSVDRPQNAEDPALTQSGVVLETYHDHRMAMSLSLAGLRIPGVRILDPACTGKTYPEFFADLEKLTGRAHRWIPAERL